MQHTSLLLLVLLLIGNSILVLTEDKTSEDKKSSENKQQSSKELEDGHKPCKIRDVGEGRKVCVCNSEYCDTIPRPKKPSKSKFILYTSNKQGLRFHKTTGQFNKKHRSKKSEYDIHVNPDQKFQKVIGWGGAFTDSTGINMKTLDKKAQDLIMKSYFSEEGIEYNVCRVPIGSTDFSVRNYTYDDSKTPDKNLEHFALAPEDFNYKVPRGVKTDKHYSTF